MFTAISIDQFKLLLHEYECLQWPLNKVRLSTSFAQANTIPWEMEITKNL